MKNNITVPTGKVVAIGELKIVMRGRFAFELPTLSFIVAENDNGGFTASCLHLMLDASANDDRAAVNNMKDTCAEFVKRLFDKTPDTAFDQLHELFTEPIGEWWNAYKDFQLNLVESGKYSSDGIVRQLAERVLKLETKQSNKENTQILFVSVIDYQDGKVAA